MISAVLITPMMLAVAQPIIEVPSTMVYNHQTQTSIVSSGTLKKIAATLTTASGTGASGCSFDGSCTDSDTDGDR